MATKQAGTKEALSYVIVKAGPPELREYHNLLKEAHLPFAPPEVPLPTLVAVEKGTGKVLGGIQVRPVRERADEAEFSHLVVSGAAKGNKLSTELFEAAVAAAKERGCTSASVIVDDPVSVALAEKFGFAMGKNPDTFTARMRKKI